MTKSMTVRQAAQEYIDGQGLLEKFRSLSNEKIGAKFECSTETVLKAWNRLPTYLPEEDQHYIRQLITERHKLQRDYKLRTYAALSRRSGHSTDRIRIELYLMGYLKEEATA